MLRIPFEPKLLSPAFITKSKLNNKEYSNYVFNKANAPLNILCAPVQTGQFVI